MSSHTSTNSMNSISPRFYMGGNSGPGPGARCDACSPPEQGNFLGRTFSNKQVSKECSVCEGTNRDPIPMVEVMSRDMLDAWQWR